MHTDGAVLHVLFRSPRRRTSVTPARNVMVPPPTVVGAVVGSLTMSRPAADVASQHVLCLAVAVSDGRHEFPPPVQSQPKIPNESDNDGMVER